VITFLGFQIDSLCMMISLPAEKDNKFLDCCHSLLVSQSITLRNLASLIGLLESSRPAIWRASLHFRNLRSDLIRGLQINQESYDALFALSSSARVELAWWLKHPQCKRQSRAPSSTGYDHRNWRLQERLGHSSSIPSDQWQMVTKRVSPTHQLSGAKGVLFGLKTFLKGKFHVNVSLQLDNRTTNAYINNKFVVDASVGALRTKNIHCI